MREFLLYLFAGITFVTSVMGLFFFANLAVVMLANAISSHNPLKTSDYVIASAILLGLCFVLGAELVRIPAAQEPANAHSLAERV